MKNIRITKKLDYYIITCVTILFTIGMFAIASATKAREGNWGHIQMQSIVFIISILVFFIVLNMDYTVFKEGAPYLYIVLLLPLVLLVAVPSLGHSTYGATRWFKIGSVQIQFSEFAKVLFILTFATHISKIQKNKKDEINKIRNIILLLAHAVIPIALIMAQPDNGTALVFCVIVASMLFIAGLHLRYFFFALISGIALLPVFYLSILPKLPKYIQNRIFVFLDPTHDPMGAGYNTIIAKISVGSGRIFGQGLFKGVQIQMNILPVKESDFIFSVIGQEMGFITCAAIILLFTILFLRFLSLARKANDYYGELIIVGITAMIAFHVLQNIGMNIGIMPVAGIPLPFISYGGSALLTNMVGIGLVMNAGMPRKRQHNIL